MKRRAYTIAEVTLASAVLAVLFGITFELYYHSNTMASKGIWRVNSTNEIRLTLRRLQQMIQSAAYPSKTDQVSLIEANTDEYKLHIVTANGTTAASGTNTIVTFKPSTTAFEILRIWNPSPINGSSGTNTANCSKYVLNFIPFVDGPGNPNCGALQLVTQTGTYTMGPTAANPTVTVTFDPTTLTETVVHDVAQLTIQMPTAVGQASGLLTIGIQCQDPFNGNLKQSTSTIVEKSVAVSSAS